MGWGGQGMVGLCRCDNSMCPHHACATSCEHASVPCWNVEQPVSWLYCNLPLSNEIVPRCSQYQIRVVMVAGRRCASQSYGSCYITKKRVNFCVTAR